MSLSNKVQMNLDRKTKDMDGRLLKAAQFIREYIIREMNDNGTEETPSHPGEPPHRITGQLINSIFVELRGHEVLVGSRLDYATYLEKGTSRMAPRPWLQPAIEATRQQVRNIIFGH